MTRRSPAALARRRAQANASMTLAEVIRTHFPFALMHKCGFAALYMKREPKEGDMLNADDFILPNGNRVDMNEQPVCFNCKEPLKHADFDPSNLRKIV